MIATPTMLPMSDRYAELIAFGRELVALAAAAREGRNDEAGKIADRIVQLHIAALDRSVK